MDDLNYVHTLDRNSADWETKDDINVIYGLLNRPSDADDIDTFNFGYDNGGNTETCHQKCIDRDECYTVTYFDSGYPCDGGSPDSTWFGECVGRTDFAEVWEPDDCTYSGRRKYEVKNETCKFRIIFNHNDVNYKLRAWVALTFLDLNQLLRYIYIS